MQTSCTTLTFALAAAILALGCEGPEGPEGPAGVGGADGDPGAMGDPGDPGTPGDDGIAPWLTAPGVDIEVTAASVSGGVATADFTLTDGDGVPLDIDGLKTEGEVSVRFTIAYLTVVDGDPVYYTAYTTRDQTSPITGDTETQASTDSGGTVEVLDVEEGRYRYTFATEVTPADASQSHRIGVYASRTVDGERRSAATTFDFAPDGTSQVVSRDVVTNDACNTCHADLVAHGSRRDVKLCVTCHSPQSVDPDTGNTVDFRIMIHKIHRGANLPSVQNGTPYEVIGHNESVHDFSTVEFPQQINRCVTCHQGDDGDFWRQRPARDTCLACHDNTSFVEPVPEGMVLHGGGTQPPDAPCAVCHPPTGSIAGITESHLSPEFDPTSPELAIEILDVTDSDPGSQPTVTFRATIDGVPEDIITNPPNRLRATFAGPNTDYAAYWQDDVLSDGSLVAVDAGDGKFAWTAETAIPADATGSYTVGFEGRINVDGTNFALHGPTMGFAVTGSVQNRRVVVDSAKCNNCHYDLAGHGGGRKNPQYCVMCHNPNNANDERSARLEGQDIFVEPVDFRNMIHKIHAGEELSESYVLGGYPPPSPTDPDGNPINFGETRFPGILSNCSACHVGGSEELPLDEGVLPSLAEQRTCTEDPAADGDDYCNDPFWVAEPVRIPAVQSACTGCHDEVATQAHAAIMTTGTGIESCATCHAPGAAYDPATLGHGL